MELLGEDHRCLDIPLKNNKMKNRCTLKNKKQHACLLIFAIRLYIYYNVTIKIHNYSLYFAVLIRYYKYISHSHTDRIIYLQKNESSSFWCPCIWRSVLVMHFSFTGAVVVCKSKAPRLTVVMKFFYYRIQETAVVSNVFQHLNSGFGGVAFLHYRHKI